MIRRNILITGPPRCGKSTLIEKVVSSIERPVTGFLTREIREGGKRVGFSINTLNGREGILAHQNINSQFNVGKYGVNLKDIDSIAVPSMIPPSEEEIIVIDEIGKMECFSHLFRETVLRALDLPNWTIGSIAQKADPFIQNIKQRDDLMVIKITFQNWIRELNKILELFDTIY
jgi:nucleoside-triphosphatase THEP1